MLDSTGDTQSNIHLGMNGLAGLANLMVGRQPAGVDGCTRAADNAAQLCSQLLSQSDALLDILADATANRNDEVRPIRSTSFLAAFTTSTTSVCISA